LGDGHARLRPREEQPELWQALPASFYLFEEGVFITAADPTHADLLGARILRFDDREVDDVIAALDPLLHRDNDNQQWVKTQVPDRLRALWMLHALSVVADPQMVALTLRDVDGETRVVELAAASDPPSLRRERSAPYPYGWISYPETRPGPLPLYLRNRGVAYWFTHLPDERIVYFQLNAMRDDPRELLRDFSARLFAFIDEHAVDKLVIDLRWNDGGNTFLALPLLQQVIGSKVNRRGRLWVIIGRRTFSAAQNGAGMFDRYTEAIFVGEPTGSSPSFVGETVEFTLPYSKATANVSDLLWQSTWPMDYRTWIAPTLYLPPTFAAYHANRDPPLEAILAWNDRLPGL